MEISYAVLADYANLSREGKPNIMGIFDVIVSATFPVTHSQMYLVSSIRAEPLDRPEQDRQIRVVLLDQYGGEILTIFGVCNFRNSPAGELGTANSLIRLKGLTFANPGNYKFQLFIDGDFKKEIPLKVEQQRQG